MIYVNKINKKVPVIFKKIHIREKRITCIYIYKINNSTN